MIASDSNRKYVEAKQHYTTFSQSRRSGRLSFSQRQRSLSFVPGVIEFEVVLAPKRLPMSTVLDAVENPPMVLRLRPALEMTDDQFFEFCQLNRDLRMERNAEGEIIIMAPAGSESSSRNIHIAAQLLAWAKADGTGRGFRLERWVQVGKRSDPCTRRCLGSFALA